MTNIINLREAQEKPNSELIRDMERWVFHEKLNSFFNFVFMTSIMLGFGALLVWSGAMLTLSLHP